MSVWMPTHRAAGNIQISISGRDFQDTWQAAMSLLGWHWAEVAGAELTALSQPSWLHAASPDTAGAKAPLLLMKPSSSTVKRNWLSWTLGDCAGHTSKLQHIQMSHLEGCPWEYQHGKHCSCMGCDEIQCHFLQNITAATVGVFCSRRNTFLETVKVSSIFSLMKGEDIELILKLALNNIPINNTEIPHVYVS